MNEHNVDFVTGVRTAVAFLANVLTLWRAIKQAEVADDMKEKEQKKFMRSVCITQHIQSIVLLMNTIDEKIVDDIIDNLTQIKSQAQAERKKAKKTKKDKKDENK